MIWLGYLFTILNYICYCCSRFMKTKKLMLLCDLLAKIFTALGLYFIGSLSGAYIFAITFFALLIANIKEQKQKNWWLIYLIFQITYIIILCKTYEGISSILVTVTTSITLYSVWWLKPQKMRLIGGFNSILYLFYQISIRNWSGLLEIFVIASNFTAFIKYMKASKKYK